MRTTSMAGRPLEKLAYLRGVGARRLELTAIPPGRRRVLAQVGRRSTLAQQRHDFSVLATEVRDYMERTIALIPR